MKKNIHSVVFTLLLSLTLVLSLSAYPASDKTEKHPLWQEGEMEIHQISTNCGESSFIIFPDGTTMLIDAGDMRTPRYFPPVPNEELSAGERIARYVIAMNSGKTKIDYFLLTHFHPDHMGHINQGEKRPGNTAGYFFETGISEVAKSLDIRKIIDRSYPDYSRPQPYDESDASFANYRKFLEWHKTTKNTPVEGFRIESTSQIKPLRQSAYNHLFLVRNIACNGIIWDWRKNETTDYVYANPKNLERKVNENLASTAMLFTYGDFSFLTGGDLCGNLLDKNGEPVNVESRLGEAAGEVDVCKTNHHGYHDAMVPEFINQVKAQLYIMPVHDSAHLGEKVIPCLEQRAAIMEKNSLIVPTYMPEDFKNNFSSSDFINHFPPEWGHVVIKIQPKGKLYNVYILDVEDEYKVKWMKGPFKSKKKT